MKKYLLMIVLSCGLTACLEEDPRGQIPEEEGYSTASQLEINAVASLYNYIGGSAESQGLMGTYRGVYDYNTFTTDEAILPVRGGDWYDGGFWQNLYYHTWAASDVSLKNTWNYLFKVVMLCNESLDKLDAHQELLEASRYALLRAEVRGLRALFYYYIMDLWGNVPLVVSTGLSVNEVMPHQRGEVFRFIVEELQEVAPLLIDTPTHLPGNYYGRMSRSVGYFLLAKLALNAEIYTDDEWTDGVKPDGQSILFTVDGVVMNCWEATLAYCNMITAAGYSLEPNYANCFKVHNENSTENIFTIPMDKDLYLNQFQYLFRSRHYVHGSALGLDAENGTCATLSTLKTFGYGGESVDNRYELNFYSDTLYVDGKVVPLEDGTPLVYMPLAVEPDVTGSRYEKTAGARMSKYEIDRTAYSDGKLQGNDIVLFRYADVVLMRAEAQVRNGGDGSAALNEVRGRAGMAAREATLANILDERLLELVWEGWRRQDLIRFGQFTESYDMRPQVEGESSGYTTVFPIPTDVLLLNRNLRQNPGY